ncbi:unnamed protein product [Adineta steineri]|uniref:Apple domain-containing protein n=1 Tax=Adineta steineri TaxID=433720 RepID=A0A813P232_9BILA|nr:unnamed protein product [Adineta steineri]CAF0746489.1 unnamed protein product [Adineta steineri]
MITSKYTVIASHWDDISDEIDEERVSQSYKRLTNILDSFLNDDANENLSIKKREDIKAAKCTEFLQDRNLQGPNILSLPDISTVENCIALCEQTKLCVAWSYYVPGKSCGLRSGIWNNVSAVSYQTGSCFEPKQKVKCNEVLYSGYYDSVVEAVSKTANSPRCLKACDQSQTCVSWYYDMRRRECTTLSSVGSWSNATNYQSGSCLGFKTLKCQEKLSGASYYGTYKREDYVNTMNDCINMCENDKICIGWSYAISDKVCYAYTNITYQLPDTKYVGGHCYRPDLKAQECESKRGKPNGDARVLLGICETDQDCKMICEQDMSCWGWSFSISLRKCWQYSKVVGFSLSDDYIGGSCFMNTSYPDILSLNMFRQQALDKHNEYRRRHCSQLLTLSDNLNEISQDYADRLATFGETPPNYSGIRMENLYYQTLNYKLQGSAPVDQWYNEKNNYNWEYPDFSKSKNFAKLIWNNVTQLGIGRAFSNDNTTMFVVATYYPGGYLEESYKQNIKREC